MEYTYLDELKEIEMELDVLNERKSELLEGNGFIKEEYVSVKKSDLMIYRIATFFMAIEGVKVLFSFTKCIISK